MVLPAQTLGRAIERPRSFARWIGIIGPCAALALVLLAISLRTGAERQREARPARPAVSAPEAAPQRIPAQDAAPAAPDRTPPSRPEARLASELARIYGMTESIRAGGRGTGAEALMIRSACRTRRGVFSMMLQEDPGLAAVLLDEALLETDDALAQGLADLLRPAAATLRDRLLVLASGSQPAAVRARALTALGSPMDAGVFAALESATRTADPAVRLAALESLAGEPRRHEDWGGSEAVLFSLRGVLETDPSPALRRAAAEAVGSMLPEGPERETYLARRVEQEADPGVRSSIQALVRNDGK